MAYDDDDILVRKPSHPVVTTLLIVSIFALSTAIWLSVQELKYYVNPTASKQLSNYQKLPIQLVNADPAFADLEETTE